MKAEDNLRGWKALVTIDGKVVPVKVITHIRDGIWLVEGRGLPKRFKRPFGIRRTTVQRTALTLVSPKKVDHE